MNHILNPFNYTTSITDATAKGILKYVKESQMKSSPQTADFSFFMSDERRAAPVQLQIWRPSSQDELGPC